MTGKVRISGAFEVALLLVEDSEVRTPRCGIRLYKGTCVLRRLTNPIGQGRKPVERITAPRAQPRTSEGITDLLVPPTSLRHTRKVPQEVIHATGFTRVMIIQMPGNINLLTFIQMPGNLPTFACAIPCAKELMSNFCVSQSTWWLSQNGYGCVWVLF